MPRVLFVTYEFPPRGGPGVQRPLKTARYLAEAGWDVTVLTVQDPPTSLEDSALLEELPEGLAVERAWSLELTRLMRLLRGSSPRPTDATAGNRGYSGMPKWAVNFIKAVALPDEKIGWIPFATSVARRLHSADPFDVILASGPPFTSLSLGMRLARRLRVPWVADFRDPIVGGYYYRPVTPAHDWWNRRFERRIVETASRVVVVTNGMRQSMIRRLPTAEDRISVVTNGFDASDLSVHEHPARSRFRISYVGTFQGSIMPDFFLRGLKLAFEKEPRLRDAIEVRFVGPLDEESAASISNTETEDWVHRTGFLPHAEAVGEMQAADVLLLLLGPQPESSAILTGKLPEYIGARRTILALVPEGDAAEVVRLANGLVIEPTAVESIAAGIVTLYAQWLQGDLPTPPDAMIEAFDRRQLVGRISTLLEEAIAEEVTRP